MVRPQLRARLGRTLVHPEASCTAQNPVSQLNPSVAEQVKSCIPNSTTSTNMWKGRGTDSISASVSPHGWPGWHHYVSLKLCCPSNALLTTISAENIKALHTSHTRTKIISANFMSLSLSTAACPGAAVMVHKPQQTPSITHQSGWLRRGGGSHSGVL